ncbi:unnamed protein product [Closterium sp. NIES-54]
MENLADMVGTEPNTKLKWCWECWRSRRPAPLSRPTATTATAATAARATAGAGGCAAGSTRGAAGAGGAGPTTDCHCLSWPLSRQLQWLGVDSSVHCLSRTTPPLSSFLSGLFKAAALGSSESAAAPGAGESAAALGARESADALGASVSTTTAIPSGSLSGLHLPAFSKNLLSNAVLQDEWVDTFIPGGLRVAICNCSRTGRHHLATFTRQPGSSLYTLTTASAQVAESGQVAASSQVSASGQLAASCSCRVLSHQTLLWHYRLGHPSLPRLHSMHSSLLVSSLPRSLPSLPRSPAPPCLTCVEGREPPLLTPPGFLQPLLLCRLSTWTFGAKPPSVEWTRRATSRWLLTTTYVTPLSSPLWCKADVSSVLIPWIHATRRQLRERFSRDFLVLRLHSDRGGEFSSDLLAELCRDKGIVQSFTPLASP